MSVNHFHSDLPATFIFPQHLQRSPTVENQVSSRQFNSQLCTGLNQPWPAKNFNLNRRSNVLEDELDDPTAAEGGEDAVATACQREWEETGDRESMFEKALTPSDVGKLNRLVIPKQQAEKHFPLGSAGDSGDKGLLLSFEDENGKSWRFRYSYWNSSQSYVLTKGWIRYVKEKRLESGDVVFFQRHQTDGDRLFIGWRRPPAQDSIGAGMAKECDGNSSGGGGGWTRLFHSAHTHPVHTHHHDHQHHNHHPPPWQPDCPHAGSASAKSSGESVGNSRILRLFGVNMECQTDVSADPPETLHDLTPPGSRFFPQLFSSNPPNNMDLMFYQDVNGRRNSRG